MGHISKIALIERDNLYCLTLLFLINLNSFIGSFFFGTVVFTIIVLTLATLIVNKSIIGISLFCIYFIAHHFAAAIFPIVGIRIQSQWLNQVIFMLAIFYFYLRFTSQINRKCEGAGSSAFTNAKNIEVKKIFGIVSISLLSIFPFLNGQPVRKLSTLYDGYDHVVHFEGLANAIECGYNVKFCNEKGVSSPLDLYPQGWHSFFGSLVLKGEHSLSENLMIYCIVLFGSTCLTFAFLTLLVEKMIAGNVDLYFRKEIILLVSFLGVPLIFILNGWAPYMLAIAIYCGAIALILEKKDLVGLVMFGISGLIYSTFWPIVILTWLIVIAERNTKKSARDVVALVSIYVFPVTIFTLQFFSVLITYTELSSGRIMYTLFWITFSLLTLLAIKSNKNNVPTFILKVFYLQIALQLLMIFYLSLKGINTSYFQEKSLGILAVVGPILMLVNIKKRIYGPRKQLKQNFRKFSVALTLTVIGYWSSPILLINNSSFITPKVRELIIDNNSFIKPKVMESLKNYQYGKQASPINTLIRNYHLVLAKPTESKYLAVRENWARNVIEMSLSSPDFVLIEPKLGMERRSMQWSNSLNRSWTSKAEQLFDEINQKKSP